MSARQDRETTWWCDFQIRCRRYRFRSPLNTRKGAEAYEALLRQKMAQGADIHAFVKSSSGKDETPSPILFEAFTKQWYETYVLPNNKASTHRSKRNALGHHLIPCFGKLALADISVLKIEEFKAKKMKEGLSPKTINNILSILRKCLTCAEEWELLVKVPRVKWLRVPPSPYKFLSLEESQRLLLGAENIFWFTMILCALRTGMRIGELCALDWSDINWEAHTIIIRRSVVEGKMDSPKSNHTRVIPVTDDLYALFSQYKRVQGLVFPGPDGNHMRKSSWPWKALARACKKAGLPRMGFHPLRHTFASQLTAKCVPMKATQMLLGHSTIAMTERYAHLAPSTLQEAVSVLPKSEIVSFESGKKVSGRSAKRGEAAPSKYYAFSPFL